MSLRTGQEYLASLDSSTREIYVDGERVAGAISQHPAFSGVARTIAELYDRQHADTDGTLTFADEAGERAAMSFLVPRSQEDLVRRRRAVEASGQLTHGFLGRSGDYMNSALTALSSATQFFANTNPVFGERVRAYVDHVRSNDLFAAHALASPQANRSDEIGYEGSSRIAAQVVEERPDGIVLRGARMLATLAPLADELLVFPSASVRGAPQDAPYSFVCAIPMDAEGLKLYCRTPFTRNAGAVDEPLASRFEETDAFVVFDDVFVPSDRVFLLGEPKLRNAWYSGTGAAALMTHQAIARSVAKTEFYLGLAAEIADAIAISEFEHVRRDLAELITSVDLLRSTLRAAEADGALSEDGVFLPEWRYLNAARNWYPAVVSERLPEIIRKFSASSLMALPGEQDLANPDERPDLDRYLQGARVSANDRVRLFKLALDASVSSFAGREALFERFFFGDPVRMASALVTGTDLTPVRERVRRLLNSADGSIS